MERGEEMAEYDKAVHSADILTARLVAFYANLGEDTVAKQDIASEIGVSPGAISRIDNVTDQNRYSVRNLVVIAQMLSVDDHEGLIEPGYLIPSDSSLKRAFDEDKDKALSTIFPEYTGDVTEAFIKRVLEDMFAIEKDRALNPRTRKTKD